jgi:putative CocE/NonD family hydrolase
MREPGNRAPGDADVTQLATPTRPAKPSGPRVSSTWIPMSDGIHLALDLILPADDERAPFPTVVTVTRYWRSFATRTPGRPGTAPIGPRAPIADKLVADGFAVVIVDARGTGASEGTWLHPWSRREVADLSEIVDWIVRQGWSSGRVGATGISYEGTTAMLMAATGHPAVRAVAPRSFEYDLYTDIALPGGVLNRAFLDAWGEAAASLDRDRPPALFGLLGRALVKGVRPVDVDVGGKGLAEIVRRRRNPSVSVSLGRIEHREDRYGDQHVTLDDISVMAHADRIRTAAVPAQVWGSWRDGTTADSALRMFAELPSVREVRIGAWSHTGEQHGSPFHEGAAPDPPLATQWQAIVGFLEGPLRRDDPGATDRAIHYFVMGEERWHSTPSWPPAGVTTRTFYLDGASRLSDAPPEAMTVDRGRLDPRASTGTGNRWHTQLAKPLKYGDRAGADRRSVTWTSRPLAAPLEVVGHPEVRLRIRPGGTDPTWFVYLEAVDPRGRVAMLTEGMLRAIHRAPRGFEVTYRRADATPIRPGELVDVTIRMLPTAVVIPAGWAVRLALTGADAETFGAPSDPADADISLEYGPDDSATLTLPVRG